MISLATRGRQPRPFDILMLIASFVTIGWILLPH
jgi:hypothetical protein